jgi:protein TonB
MVNRAVLFGLSVSLIAISEGPAAAASPASPPRLLDGPSFMVNNDYPREALKLRQEGNTSVSLQISAKGKVTDCRITGTSGSKSLDDATCSIMSKLKFKPAVDAEGDVIEGEFVRQMAWTLPRH